ncbi:MAG: hypothetical protein IJG38_04965 [Thermoguttaceae bacterium]|nr:hypothetical protein [Thermoguttaceae bacterium]
MANNNQNDIVINAKANTKEAEANIQRLDNRIKDLSKNNSKLDGLSGRLGRVGRQAQQTSAGGMLRSNNMTQMGFSGLQGSFTGVITKLGMIGLMIGALVKTIQLMSTAGRRTFEGLESNVKATDAAIEQLDGSAKGLLSELEKLSELQKNSGTVDSTVLEREHAIIDQLSKSWGNLGLKVNDATGEVIGFFNASSKINEQVNFYKVDNAAAKIEVAKRKLENAQRDFDNVTTNTYTGSKYGAAWLERPGDMFQATVGNLTGRAANFLSGNDSFRTDNDVEVQQDVVDKAKADVQQARTELKQAEEEYNRLKANLSPQELALLAARSKAMADAQAGINGRDAKEQQLILNLAQAQLGNGSVDVAKERLESYQAEKRQRRADELNTTITTDQEAVAKAQRRYDIAMAGTDVNKQADAAIALNNAMRKLDGHIQELNQLGTGQIKPADTPRGSAFSGTFDSYGLNGLASNPIEQQQLEVQKQIAKNTEGLNAPIVGE